MSSAGETSTDEQLKLINRNLQEVIGEDIMKGCLERTGTMNVYWGTAPTGRPHIAYFLPMMKLADFLKAKCEVTILFADLHAYLDNVKAPWELLDKRTEYYEILIKGVLRSLQVPIDRLSFIRGTHFQLEENYSKAVYQIIRLSSVRDATKAGCEVVKQLNDPLLSSLVYPLLQSLDEEFLNVDAQFGGTDQRKIFVFAEENLPLLFFAKRAHLMNKMIPGLTGGKMSSSEEDSKIDLLDTEETVRKKLQNANCQGKTSETNGILAFLECIALPIKGQLDHNLLNRYKDIKEIEDDLDKGRVSEEELKDMVASILWTLMSPLRNEFVKSGKERLIDDAYPVRVPDANVDRSDREGNEYISEHDLDTLRSEFPEMQHVSIDSMPKIQEKPSIMWSCRCSGDPHIGYLIPIRKLATLSNRNWKVIILIEDIGAFLHSKNASSRPSWDKLQGRAKTYKEMCERAFELFGGNISNLEIVLGSQYQLSKTYMLQLYQCLTKVTLIQCTNMLQELYKDDPTMTKNLSSVIYLCLSVLDQHHLKPTVRLLSKRKETIDQDLIKSAGLEHQMPIYVYHLTLLSLDGINPMSSFATEVKSSSKKTNNEAKESKAAKNDLKTSIKEYKPIYIGDTEKEVQMKVNKIYLDADNLDANPTLDIIEKILWPQLGGSRFCIERSLENGGDINDISPPEILEKLRSKKLHPKDLKAAMSRYLIKLIMEPMTQNSLISFNPNKINIHVAEVVSVTHVNNVYTYTLKYGINKSTFQRNFVCNLEVNDLCLVIIRPSSSTSEDKIVDYLKWTNKSAIKLMKKAYASRVTFGNHPVCVPHFDVINIDKLLPLIKQNLVTRGKDLFWRIDESLANDIELEVVGLH